MRCASFCRMSFARRPTNESCQKVPFILYASTLSRQLRFKQQVVPSLKNNSNNNNLMSAPSTSSSGCSGAPESVSSSSQPTWHDAPPGVDMPKKKDPRLRELQAPTHKAYFDSADYEVQRQQNKSKGSERRVTKSEDTSNTANPPK